MGCARRITHRGCQSVWQTSPRAYLREQAPVESSFVRPGRHLRQQDGADLLTELVVVDGSVGTGELLEDHGLADAAQAPRRGCG
jgi:hypothetical protein